MNPPGNLDAASRKLFQLVVRELESRSALRDVDAPAIARYVLAEQVARLALARIAKREKSEGVEAAWSQQITHGGRGQHADVKTYLAASAQAASFAHDLTLTPRARARLRDQAPTGPDVWAEFLQGVS
jgi:P27 family predicted phage terminase small subunit